MADATVPAGGNDAMEEMLGRLSKKSGVKATLVLDRTTGAVLKTSGQLGNLRSSRHDVAAPPNNTSYTGETSTPQSGDAETAAAAFAVLVWGFVKASGTLVDELDQEDEVKLLRLRTKKQELVIVPDPKYLLVVVHDTPPA